LTSKLRGKYTGLFLLAILMLPLISVSVGYAQKQEKERAEKFVEIAMEAKERLEELMDTIGEIPDEIEKLYKDGVEALETAEAELKKAEPDYGLAIEKAREAMDAFREVFKRLHTLLKEEEEAETEEEEVEEEGAETLTEAIERARARIKRVRDLIKENEEYLTDYAEGELDDLLDDAENLLDAAEDALEDGDVSTAAHKLGDANKLISQAFVALKKASGPIHSGKMKGFLTVISKFYERVERLVERAEKKGIIEEGKYDNELEVIKGKIEDAKEEEDFEDAVAYLMEARMRLESIQEEIRESMKGGPKGG